MSKADTITNNNNISNLAVDGVIYGSIAGFAMYIFLAVLALLSGESPAALLERFSTSGVTSPLQGLISHLAVSAIYGTFFGAFLWPLLTRFATPNLSAWIGGLFYASFLFLLSQIAILPITSSPLGQIPDWQWAVGHAVYGLVLGVLFARKA